ncbi:MAG: tRNA (adenosine(37)-N6)-threonylcarbamoyltransferase complex dimerization subunit type 1 TsaB [Spirochaetaceae bacterium]|jgi:tRNA threonylcarbamoyladenosine biosynthesis protein TsaB|nr:tRNA (adenosine(37)-N6)-threonylcarbamoyltransferase complex dimerization subunit type 1 TsaB [Spirochaetaceae bacterium]
MDLKKEASILAIDTSMDYLSAALKTPQGIFTVEVCAGARHSELLIEAADSVFRLAGISAEDVDLFACMEGPGSFTGLRIGFAAVKGFALAMGKPMIPCPTLECIALPFENSNCLVVPLIDAKQKRFFTALFKNGEKLTENLDALPELIAELISANEEGKPVLLCGNGAEAAKSELMKFAPKTAFICDPEFKRGRAALMLKYIEKTGKVDNISLDQNCFSAPVYLRKSDAEITIEKRILNAGN